MPTQTSNPRTPLKGTQTGHVVSDKRDKTRKVMISFLAKVPKYGKYVNRRTYFQVDDPTNVSKEGDLVEIVPCRPISKTKSWRLVRVIQSAPAPVEGVAQ
jgi:small subunit ribosomal protein S17